MNRAHLPTNKLLTGALLTLALIAAAPAGAGRLAAAGYPSSMAVLGQDDAAGFGSDPAHPYASTPSNSWATGTNPAVDSIYQRILGANPAIKGKSFNFARYEDGIDTLQGQVGKALRLSPRPGLVLIDISGEVNCDGNDDSRVTQFGAAIGTALSTLTKGDPGVRIFLNSAPVSYPSYVAYLKGLPTPARLKHAGKGPCQLVSSPSAQVVPSHVAYQVKYTDAYDAQLAAQCRKFANCRYDGNAAARIAVTAAEMSSDQEHLSVQGQAKLAATEWTAMSAFLSGA